MERRRFLGGLTAASFGVRLENALAEPARSQTGARLDRQDFETSQVEVAGNRIFVRRYGNGPAILLVHGFPRTSLMWRFLAPKLAENHTVICVDLRAYGRSGIPTSADDHFPYSKRAMAKELVDVMVQLGFPTFTVIGHDRGGRVSYRLALDHPKNVERLAVFDVIPILEGWSRSDARFAQTYWPWILLAQKEPLPEKYLLGAPEAVFHNPFGEGSFGPKILEEYVSTYRDPARVHGICEEYRAAATIDVEHDRADKESSNRIECPMLHLWAEGGPLDTFYAKDGGPLGIWRQWDSIAPNRQLWIHAAGYAKLVNGPTAFVIRLINWKYWMALFQHFGSNLAAYFAKNNFLRHAVLAWDWRHRTFRHRQQLMLRYTAAVLCQQTLRINFYPGRIRSESVRVHIGIGLFYRTTVHLKLHSIAIGIPVTSCGLSSIEASQTIRAAQSIYQVPGRARP